MPTDEPADSGRAEPAGHRAFAERRVFGSLDGLRAISVLAVIWHHAGSGHVEGALKHAGAHGVTLFFAISGFLITTLLLRERERTGSIDLGAFYMRRALRIFPLYYAVLAVYAVLVAVMERHSREGEAFWRHLPYFLTYTSNLFVALEGRTIFYFSWSLAAEEQFYLIWPTLLRALRSRRLLTGLLLAVLLTTAALQHAGVHGFRNFPVAIVAGALLAVTLDSHHGWSLLHRATGWRGASLLALTAMVASTLMDGVPAPVPQLAAAVLVATCVIREDHALAGVLSLRLVRYWGQISYGMYLLHMLCRNATDLVFHRAGIAASGLTVFVACVLLTTAVAGVSFRYFEQPFLRLKSRYVR